MIPFYLSGTAGKLFCVYHEPSGNAAELGDLVFVPPFAEELNQSRHTVSRMARSLARRGWGVLLLDLFGTGDSGGGFEECRWDIWREDVMAAHSWLRDRRREGIGLWGLRLGGLLAADLAAAHPDLFSLLILWEPVTSGKNYLNQFLRLRAVSALTDTHAPRVSTSELHRRLAGGDSVRVAGYPLAPALAQDLGSLEMAHFVPGSATPTFWFELVAGPTAHPSASSLQIAVGWQARGANVTMVPVVDNAVWSIQALEPISADELIAKTMEQL
jgi:exosortase A-associated hydrolase 2